LKWSQPSQLPDDKRPGGRFAVRGLGEAFSPTNLADMAQQSGRFTPKQSSLPAKGVGTGSKTSPEEVAPAYASSGRYTPKVAATASGSAAKVQSAESPPWVAWLMFTFFAIGLVVIVLNYTKFFWETSNWALIGGLGAIVAGFITATKLR
jgi:hypothetical protein